MLDTHIWLWSLGDRARLGRRVLHELENVNNQLWLSPVSTWEAILLSAKAKIRVSGRAREWVAQAAAFMREAPLTHEIALAAYELSLPHSDPVDRFLVATAQVLDLTLVTADVRLLGLGEIKTLANR